MARYYSSNTRPPYSGPSREERAEQIYQAQTYQSPSGPFSQPSPSSGGGSFSGFAYGGGSAGAGRQPLPGFTPPSSSYAGRRYQTGFRPGLFFSSGAGGGAGAGAQPDSTQYSAADWAAPGVRAQQPATAQQAPTPPYTPQQQQPATAPQQQQGFDYSQILEMFQQSMAEANAANEARYQQGLDIHGQIVDIYAPGGGFGAGYEAQLERTKTRDVAAAQQQMTSSGLWGTTVAAALPSAWEETVGQPGRLAIQDMQWGRYGQALAGQAGFIEGRTDAGPDMGLFAGLMQGAYAGPMGGGGQAGGGAVPSSQRPNMGRTGTPGSSAAPVPGSFRPGHLTHEESRARWARR